ncbi:MAG: hypothetical protein Q7N50_07835 [Armatimonadota bacterium]|nr:hypothetical protein [Armatimonadota bacterium]
MFLPFAHRVPTNREIERIRLILSTYQDGTGMLAIAESSRTIPGWRDFERSVALALGGTCAESKAVFDVTLSDDNAFNYGISCKMRRELDRIRNKDGRVTVEVSNSNSKFWEHLATIGIDHSNYMERPQEVGIAITNLVHSWHHAESKSLNIDLSGSCYLVLSYNKSGMYQLHQFNLNLFNPSNLEWNCPVGPRGASRLVGNDDEGIIIEWYMNSGGQLKYYPPEGNAIWKSEIFYLEPLPDITEGILRKVDSYYPKLWADANRTR